MVLRALSKNLRSSCNKLLWQVAVEVDSWYDPQYDVTFQSHVRCARALAFVCMCVSPSSQCFCISLTSWHHVLLATSLLLFVTVDRKVFFLSQLLSFDFDFDIVYSLAIYNLFNDLYSWLVR